MSNEYWCLARYMYKYQVWLYDFKWYVYLFDSDVVLDSSVFLTMTQSVLYFICEDPFHYMMQVLWVFCSGFLLSL